MTGDPGMAYLNMLLDAEFELHFRRAAFKEKEAYRDGRGGHGSIP